MYDRDGGGGVKSKKSAEDTVGVWPEAPELEGDNSRPGLITIRRDNYTDLMQHGERRNSTGPREFPFLSDSVVSVALWLLREQLAGMKKCLDKRRFWIMSCDLSAELQLSAAKDAGTEIHQFPFKRGENAFKFGGWSPRITSKVFGRDGLSSQGSRDKWWGGVLLNGKSSMTCPMTQMIISEEEMAEHDAWGANGMPASVFKHDVVMMVMAGHSHYYSIVLNNARNIGKAVKFCIGIDLIGRSAQEMRELSDAMWTASEGFGLVVGDSLALGDIRKAWSVLQRTMLRALITHAMEEYNKAMFLGLGTDGVAGAGGRDLKCADEVLINNLIGLCCRRMPVHKQNLEQNLCAVHSTQQLKTVLQQIVNEEAEPPLTRWPAELFLSSCDSESWKVHGVDEIQATVQLNFLRQKIIKAVTNQKDIVAKWN